MSRVLEQLAKRAVSLAMYCTAHATSSTNVRKFDVECEGRNTNVLIKGKLYCAKDAHHYLSMTCNALCKLAKESSRAGQTTHLHKSNFSNNNSCANSLTDHNVYKECDTHEILHLSAVMCLRQLESCIKMLPPDYELHTETILYIISIIRYATSHKSESNENINNNNNNMKEATDSKGTGNASDSIVISQCELEELLMQVNAHVSMFSIHQWKPVWLFHGIHAIARIDPPTHPPMLSDMCAVISSHLSSISPAASATLLWSLAKLHLERRQRELWSLVCQRCRNVHRSMNEVSQLTLTYALLLANDCTCTAQERLLQLSYEALQECNGAHNSHSINMSSNNNYNRYNDTSVNEGRSNAESNTFLNNRQSLQAVEHNDDVHNNNTIIASDVANVYNTSSTRVTIRDLLKRQSYGAIKLHLLANTHAMSTEVLLDLMASVLANICHDSNNHLTRNHTLRKANVLEKDMELARNVCNWQNEIALTFLGQEAYEKYSFTSKRNVANHNDEFHQLEYILSQICQKSLNERRATQLLSLSLTAHAIYKSCHPFSHASHTNHSNLSMVLEKVVYRTTMYLFTLPVSQLIEVHTVLHLITQVWIEFGDALFHKRRSGQIKNNAENNFCVIKQKREYSNIQSDVPCIDYAECQEKMSQLLLESLKRITTRVERKIDVGMLWSLLISCDLLQLTGYNTQSINKQEEHKSIKEIEELRKENVSSRSSNINTTLTVVKNNLEHVQQLLSKLMQTWLTHVKKQNIRGNNINNKSNESNTSCIYKLAELIACAMKINLCSFSKQCDNKYNSNNNTTLRTSEGTASMILSFTLLDKVLQLLTETYLPSCTDVNVLIHVLHCTSFTVVYEEQQEQQQSSIEFYQKLRQVQEIATRQLEHCPVNKHTLDAITACLLCHKTNSQATSQGMNNDSSGHPVICSNNDNTYNEHKENRLVDKSEKSIHRERSVLSSSSSSFSVGKYSHKTQSSFSLIKGEMMISDKLLDLYIRLVVHHATAHNDKSHHNSVNVINVDYLTVLMMCCEQREYSINALEQFYKMLLTRRFGQAQSFIDCVSLPVYALVQLITSALLLCHLHSGMAVGVLSTLMTQLTRYGVAQCRTIAELNSVAPLLSLPIVEQLKLKTSLATATVQCASTILQERKLGRGDICDKRNDISNNCKKSINNELCGENQKDALMKLLSYTDTPLEKGYFIAYLIRAEVNVPESLLELMRAETAFMTPKMTNSDNNNNKVSRSDNLHKENTEFSLEEQQKEETTNLNNANEKNDVDDLLCASSARRTRITQVYANLSECNLEELEEQQQQEEQKIITQ